MESKSFLFITTEAWRESARIIMDILHPVNNSFAEKYGECNFSDNLDDIGIIPVCLPKNMIEDGSFKERRYVSLKKRYADIRLHIPYEEFMKGDKIARISLCAKNIADAVAYVKKKDKSLDAEKLLAAISDSFEACHGKALKGLLERYFK